MTVEAPLRTNAPEIPRDLLDNQTFDGTQRGAEMQSPGPAVAESMSMAVWLAETRLSGPDRRPIMTPDETQNTWGKPYGALIAEVTLPYQERMRGGGRDSAYPSDLKGKVLEVFDARRRPEEPPHFIVATREALDREAALDKEPPIVRPDNPDIQHIFSDEQLLIGREPGRWLSSGVQTQEEKRRRAGVKKSLISSKQGSFYVDDDGELHLRSEGFNPLELAAHRTAEEKARSDEFYSRGPRAERNERTVRIPDARPEAYTGRHRRMVGALAVRTAGKHRASGRRHKGGARVGRHRRAG